jgi:hypothetical protein
VLVVVLSLAPVGLARASYPDCYLAAHVDAMLDGASVWKAMPEVGGSVWSVATTGERVFVIASDGHQRQLLELVGDRWQPVAESPPRPTNVIIVGEHIYVRSFIDSGHGPGNMMSYTWIGAPRWIETADAPFPGPIDLFACGDALCASTGVSVNDKILMSAASPEPIGALAAWTSVTINPAGRHWGSTRIGGTEFALDRDHVYARVIDRGGRYRSFSKPVGSPLPYRSPSVIGRGNWLFALGGMVPEPGSDGLCPREKELYFVHGARIGRDGEVGAWAEAAPLPRGGVRQVVATTEWVYAFLRRHDQHATDVVAIRWSDLMASTHAPEPHAPVAAGALRPYRITIPPGWIETPSDSFEPDASFALEYQAVGHPETTLHVEWIDQRVDPRTKLEHVEQAMLDHPDGSAIEDIEDSLMIEETHDRGPHVRHLRIAGSVDGDHVQVAAAVCAGPRGRIDACEMILETLAVERPRSLRRVISSIIAMAAIVLLGLIVSWRVRRGLSARPAAQT